jgi:hypothetical protein
VLKIRRSCGRSRINSAIYKALGYPVRLVAIRYDSMEFQHVFVEVFLSGDGWVWIDPTVVPHTLHKEIERMVENV